MSNHPILLLDNYDSFTYNLADYLGEQGIRCCIKRNDCSWAEIIRNNYSGIVLSPGPGVPEQAGHMMKVIDYYFEKVPMLGICLGHQAIAQYFGAKIKKAKVPMHGKISRIICKEDAIFTDMPSSFHAVRYHSMVIDHNSPYLSNLAYTQEDEIMVVRHKDLPLYGIQYHPEAAMTEYGQKILQNWINLSKIPKCLLAKL